MEKALNALIKLGSMGIVMPATIQVVNDLFAAYPLAVRIPIVICGVMVIELVLVSNWVGLESKRNELPELKLRQAVSLWVMYLATVFIGLAHGEQWAALPLRLAMGLAIAGSTWDTGVWLWNKATLRADRDIHTTGRVRREARKQAETVEVARIRSNAALELQAIDQRARVEGTRLTKQSGRELRKVTEEFAELPPEAITSVCPEVSQKRSRKVITDKAERSRMARQMKADGLTVKDYMERTGLKKTSAYQDWREVESVLSTNGNGRH